MELIVDDAAVLLRFLCCCLPFALPLCHTLAYTNSFILYVLNVIIFLFDLIYCDITISVALCITLCDNDKLLVLQSIFDYKKD